MTGQHFSLFELNNLVRQAIEASLTGPYWVEAEVAEAREKGGHCYINLVQNGPDLNTPIAKASAICWRQTWAMISQKFEKTTSQRFRSGLKVLLLVRPQFRESYGFSWIIADIDPTFTIGDMALRRKQIIEQLKKEGVFDLNRSLPIPLFCQRIAVVTSEGAAGWGDFKNHLLNNEYGYKFLVRLFPAIMQGEDVEKTVIAALNAINKEADNFDCVVIIRGGGATSDMSGFDTLPLAENVAQFPLPIITGIGHDRDECVLDMVANTRVKTPTAAADLLLNRLRDVEVRIEQAQQGIVNSVKTRMETEKLRLGKLSERIPSLFSLVKSRNEANIKLLYERLTGAVRIRLANESHRLEMLSEKIKARDPALLLQRGYSITTVNGKAVSDASTLHEGDIIETRLNKGIIKSKTIEIWKKK